MEDMRFVAYYRVSTQRQGIDGYGIDAQKTAVENYIARDKRHRLLKPVFKETESGKRSDRPELAKALAACRLHNARLIVAKLDRLARNADFLQTIQKQMGEQGVVFCDMSDINATGPNGRFVIGIMAHVAQLEADLISQRTIAALVAAKARGVKLGGNPGNLLLPDRKGVKRSIAVRQAKARQRKKDLVEIVGPMRKGGATLTAIADALNKQTQNKERIPAPRGGQWHPASVARILA